MATSAAGGHRRGDIETRHAAKLGEAVQCGMVNEGIDVFHGGGLLSIAHTEADIDRTIEAFDTTIRRMVAEDLF